MVGTEKALRPRETGAGRLKLGRFALKYEEGDLSGAKTEYLHSTLIRAGLSKHKVFFYSRSFQFC